MLGLLPRPLDDDLRATLCEVARAQRLPTLDDPARLGPLVARLSAAYNDPFLRGVAGVDHRAARLSFSLPRDIPKMAAAVREVVAMGRLTLGREGLSVLDLGVGLGASHRGLARALDAAGQRGELSITAIDHDLQALALLKDLSARRPREGTVALQVRTEQGGAHDFEGKRRYDVVLLGQVLSELDLDRPEEERVERHRALLGRLARTLTPGGMLVVVEPALRVRARHLQRLRQVEGLRVLTPCLHEGACPLLGKESDWCHEDLPIDLPPWLVPVAKAAGLRREGLTFSYLVLAPKGPSLREHLVDERHLVRMVSASLPSKGKREAIVCGDPLRTAGVEDAYGKYGFRLGRLDREAADANAPFDEAQRGDLLAIEGALDDKGRIDRRARVALK